ncbi:hypothetical protein [Haliscomenobacter hydrossis]|uniref:Glycosyl transferase family 28 C-terminal domain-containing protein n=1 Tax=Haliscomenobacter hydrossis (strain ATCC 27775 / DSM 1100 / LMG 10767 / O) TaxID=760192 RepID=F4L1N9_HALH1|nr:hypothetical protein [Haliscomenobacter hydrossis]AEE48583.1 hypothetical protein Halhy_0675 [Haliscomenobacter hydrossis DSM 1100]
MNILNLPYFAGGLSHLLPLYVLHHKYIKHQAGINNYFLVNNNWQRLLTVQGLDCVPIDYFGDEALQLLSNNHIEAASYAIEKQQEAYDKVKPALIIEDTVFIAPLIAEKNDVPRISIQRTGIFRSIDERYRNNTHVHSLQKGDGFDRSAFFSNNSAAGVNTFDEEDALYLEKYTEPKAKIIPGIPTIERLPEDIANRDSYFYAGPLIVKDKPSKNLTDRLDEFLMINKQKQIVFITTGTVDKTPIEKYIEFFVSRNYAVITTCDCEINNVYPKSIFYNKLLPLHHICKISNLVVHQCGSGMYHYPIMNRAPFLTLGTQCFDREDIAQRLQELGVSGHIPHPDDDPDHWQIFVDLVARFENNTLTDYDMMDKLRKEINETMANFNMEEVIRYALS